MMKMSKKMNRGIPVKITGLAGTKLRDKYKESINKEKSAMTAIAITRRTPLGARHSIRYNGASYREFLGSILSCDNTFIRNNNNVQYRQDNDPYSNTISLRSFQKNPFGRNPNK